MDNRERETERETERQRDRQTDRQRGRWHRRGDDLIENGSCRFRSNRWLDGLAGVYQQNVDMVCWFYCAQTCTRTFHQAYFPPGLLSTSGEKDNCRVAAAGERSKRQTAERVRKASHIQ